MGLSSCIYIYICLYIHILSFIQRRDGVKCPRKNMRFIELSQGRNIYTVVRIDVLYAVVYTRVYTTIYILDGCKKKTKMCVTSEFSTRL